MKSLRTIQYERVRQIYQELLVLRHEHPSIENIVRLAEEIIYSTDMAPLSGKYRVESYEPIDVASMNAEVGLIRGDVESLYAFISAVQGKLRELAFVGEVWKRYAHKRVQATILDVARLTAGKFVNGFTEELDLAGIVDRNETDLVINDYGELVLPVVASIPKNSTYQPRDVSVQRIGEDLVARVYGDPHVIFSRGNLQELLLSLSGKKTTEAGFRIEARVKARDVNRVFIRMGEETRGIAVTLALYTEDNQEVIAYRGVVKHPYVDVTIDAMDIERMVLTLTMNVPNVQLSHEVRYEFRLYSVLLLSETTGNSGIFQSSAIELEDNVEYVQLVSDHVKSSMAYIKYYVATNEDDEGNATGFIAVDPQKEGGLIPVVSQRMATEICLPGGQPHWFIKPLKQYGSRLYNLLDGMEDIEIGDLSITDGQLVLENNGTVYEIIPESVRLYRGVGDYLRKYREATSELQVEPTVYHTVLTTDSKWIDPLELKFRIEKEQLSSFEVDQVNDSTTITFPRAVDADTIGDIRIETSEGAAVYFHVTDWDETSIVIDTALDSLKNYYVSYTSKLEESVDAGTVVVVDPLDIEVTVGNESLAYGTDFMTTQVLNKVSVHLLPSGRYRQHFRTNSNLDTLGNTRYTNESARLSIQYKLQLVKSASVTYYETNVYASVPTDIDLVPFTPAEIAVGNFHRVNGQDVSLEKTFLLPQGWSIIQTTQPYPTWIDSEYDTNRLTDEPSSACIILPESIEKVRPYRDSMRNVSPFILSTMAPDEGTSCFSYTGGMFLVNFLPDFADEARITDILYAGAEGSTFICKKPIYDMDYTNTGWRASPERFDVEFAYHVSGETKKLYVRVEMGISRPGQIVRIGRLGLNKFRSI